MQILTTFPGRHGDLLWALPTVRAIADTYGELVDLVVSAKYGSLAPLIERQPYIGEVHVLQAWGLEESAPIGPRVPPALDADYREDAYARVYHLGYEGWPTPNLPMDIWRRAARQEEREIELQPIDLTRPWITPPSSARYLSPSDLAVGFSDEHFELKYGIYFLLYKRYGLQPGASYRTVMNISGAAASPRWQQEAEAFGPDWEGAAAWISNARCFLGCCSALHVLAVALDVPAVVVEPNPHRLAEVFWPLGFDGPRVQVVRGGDGLPTWDARHTAEAIEAVWARTPAAQPTAVIS